MKTIGFFLISLAAGCWPRGAQVVPMCLQMKKLMKNIVFAEQQRKYHEDTTEILFPGTPIETHPQRRWWTGIRRQHKHTSPILYQFALHVAISHISESQLIVPTTGYRLSSEKVGYIIIDNAGESLSRYVQRFRAELPEYNFRADLQYLEEVVQIGHKAFDLLENLHALGVVHGRINVDSFVVSRENNWVLTKLNHAHLTCYPLFKNAQDNLPTFKDDVLNLMKVFAFLFCGKITNRYFANEWYLVNGHKCFELYMIPVAYADPISRELTNMLSYVRSIEEVDFSRLRIFFRLISNILYYAEKYLDYGDSLV